MRKLLAAVFAVGLIAVTQAPSFAQVTVSSTTLTATVQFTGVGAVNMQALLYNISDNSQASQLTFASPGGGMPPTGWEASSQYILLHSTITHATGFITIYTNNYHNTDHSYSGVVNSSYSQSPAGLVDNSTTTKVLPMCWRVSAVSTDSLHIVQGPVGPAPLYQVGLFSAELGGAASLYPCFLWMEDAGMWGFTGQSITGALQDYRTIRDVSRGIQHGEATWGSGVGSPVYVYVGANFTNATTPNTYKTTSLTIEALHE